MDFLLDFVDYKKNQVAFFASRIYRILPRTDSDGVRSLIEWESQPGKVEKTYLFETFEEVVDYIKTGKWERIK